MIKDLVLPKQFKYKIYMPCFQFLQLYKKYEVGDWCIIHLKNEKGVHHIGDGEILDVKCTTFFNMPIQTAYMTIGEPPQDYIQKHFDDFKDIIEDIEKHEIFIYLIKMTHRVNILDDELKLFLHGY